MLANAEACSQEAVCRIVDASLAPRGAQPYCCAVRLRLVALGYYLACTLPPGIPSSYDGEASLQGM
jgi:hypothetical protein